LSHQLLKSVVRFIRYEKLKLSNYIICFSNMDAVDINVSKSDFHICGTFFLQNCTFQAIVFYFNLKTVQLDNFNFSYLMNRTTDFNSWWLKMFLYGRSMRWKYFKKFYSNFKNHLTSLTVNWQTFYKMFYWVQPTTNGS
jgi:hypothetical protein